MTYQSPTFKFSGISSYFLLLFCLLLFTGCESRRTIVHNTIEKEANEILFYLSTKGVTATKIQSIDAGGAGGKKETLWDISVPADQVTEAMSLLNQAGLPRRKPQSLLNIFQDVGLVPSELQQKIRYQAGLAEQIASVIRKIDGVLDAEVQISFPDDDPLNPGKKKGNVTASVYVKHAGVLDDPNTHLITKIRRFIAGSVPELSYDNVTVIPDRARFSELPPGFLGSINEEKDFVRIWSIIIAQESLTRFRFLFFSFLILILIFFLSFVWIGWKLLPILQTHGWKELFKLTPLVEVKKTEKEEVKEEEKAEEETGDEETAEKEEKEKEGEGEENEEAEKEIKDDVT